MLRNVFILSNILCAVTGICMDYWTRFGNSCYFFAHLPADRVTWHEAVQECTWKKSHLVIVESKAENDFIKHYIAEITRDRSDQFWTFGNDIHTENEWNWGFSPNRMTPTFWYPGEPTNNGGPGVDEDCMAFHPGFNYDWNDKNCDHDEYYICEIS